MDTFAIVFMSVSMLAATWLVTFCMVRLLRGNGGTPDGNEETPAPPAGP